MPFLPTGLFVIARGKCIVHLWPGPKCGTPQALPKVNLGTNCIERHRATEGGRWGGGVEGWKWSRETGDGGGDDSAEEGGPKEKINLPGSV